MCLSAACLHLFVSRLEKSPEHLLSMELQLPSAGHGALPASPDFEFFETLAPIVMDSTAQWRLRQGLCFMTSTLAVCAARLEATLSTIAPRRGVRDVPQRLQRDLTATLECLYSGRTEGSALLPFLTPAALALAGGGALPARTSGTMLSSVVIWHLLAGGMNLSCVASRLCCAIPPGHCDLAA